MNEFLQILLDRFFGGCESGDFGVGRSGFRRGDIQYKGMQSTVITYSFLISRFYSSFPFIHHTNPSNRHLSRNADT